MRSGKWELGMKIGVWELRRVFRLIPPDTEYLPRDSEFANGLRTHQHYITSHCVVLHHINHGFYQALPHTQHTHTRDYENEMNTLNEYSNWSLFPHISTVFGFSYIYVGGEYSDFDFDF